MRSRAGVFVSLTGCLTLGLSVQARISCPAFNLPIRHGSFAAKICRPSHMDVLAIFGDGHETITLLCRLILHSSIRLSLAKLLAMHRRRNDKAFKAPGRADSGPCRDVARHPSRCHGHVDLMAVHHSAWPTWGHEPFVGQSEAQKSQTSAPGTVISSSNSARSCGLSHGSMSPRGTRSDCYKRFQAFKVRVIAADCKRRCH